MTREKRFWSWVGIVAVLVGLIFVFRSVLMPFVAGAVIAYFLDPALDRMVKKGMSRLFATILVTGLFFAIVASVIILIVPLLQAQFVGFAKVLPSLIEMATQYLTPVQELFREKLTSERIAALKDATKTLGSELVSWILELLKGVFDGGVAFFNLLALVFITPLVSFYLLRDWDVIVVKFDQLLPRDHAETVRGIIKDVDETIAGFVRGQGIVMLSLAAFYGISLTLTGLDFGLLVGIGAGLISFVPYFGMLIGLAISLTIAVVQFGEWVPVVFVLAVFGLGQIVESFYLTPKLVGESVGLHALWVIFALMAGGALFGFTGVLLAIPVAATIGVLVRFFLAGYLDSALYSGRHTTTSTSDAEDK